MKQAVAFRLLNSYAGLAEVFHARVTPTPLANARLVAISPSAARLLDLQPADLFKAPLFDWLQGHAGLPGSDPVSMCYAGHQFGHWVPQLGDGRAIILGEIVSEQGHWEVQLKGAGLTPFSRDGDGRAVLRSTIREYLCSEAMQGLGIPTTRALCLFDSDEAVYRERVERGALLVRLAPSHVRFGSFEVFYYRQQYGRLRELADYVIAHDFPALQADDAPYHALLREVILRTARLLARWQLVGFAHGVMNTDNMSVLGLTLDYGPFGYMEAYDPGFICNHSDHNGRYAFDRQPSIALWNLTCLAQAMLPLLNPDDGAAAARDAETLLTLFEPAFRDRYTAGLRGKLGLAEARVNDGVLADRLLDLMQEGGVDFTRLFRDLATIDAADDRPVPALRDRFIDRLAFDGWLADYRQRLRGESRDDETRRAGMRAVNPRFVLRNYLAERAIRQAEAGDFAEIERLRLLLSRPYDEQPEMADYAQEPPDWGRELVVSCSS